MPGGGERIDHPQRGGHHDDVAMVVAGCLVALATPISGAEGWCEFYRRLSEEPWGRSCAPACRSGLPAGAVRFCKWPGQKETALA